MKDDKKSTKNMVLDAWKKLPGNLKDMYQRKKRRVQLSGKVMDARYPAGWSKQSGTLETERKMVEKKLKKGTYQYENEGWYKKSHKK